MRLRIEAPQAKALTAFWQAKKTRSVAGFI
jgi:hypothetical protein